MSNETNEYARELEAAFSGDEATAAARQYDYVADAIANLPVATMPLDELIARCSASATPPSGDVTALWTVLSSVAPEQGRSVVVSWADAHGVPTGDLTAARECAAALVLALGGQRDEQLGLLLARAAQALGVVFASSERGTKEDSARATVRTVVETASSKRRRAAYSAAKAAVAEIAQQSMSVGALGLVCAKLAPEAETIRNRGGHGVLHFWAGALGVPCDHLDGWSDLEPKSQAAWAAGREYHEESGAPDLAGALA